MTPPTGTAASINSKSNTSSLESALRHDRIIVLTALSGIAVVAWLYMIYEARKMEDTGVCQCFGLAMSGPDVTPWSLTELLPLTLMWAEMMVAMMIPSAAPMILTFAMVNRKRRSQARPYVPTGLFLAGYLIVWTVFSLAAAIAQWVLHGAALLSPMMESTSPILGGALLIAAGVFQWTPFKHACLMHCRTPLQFLLNGWREGPVGALRMGITHGTYCAGCCWLLMALLFVIGVMNMIWVAIISLVVLLEKVLPRGLLLGKVTGVLFAVWGAWMIFSAMSPEPR
jgi:predicted metal-binding membrane protein